MEKNKSTFSLSRILRLVKMEVSMTWRDLLIFCLIFVAAQALISALTWYNTISESTAPHQSIAINAFYPIGLFAFGFFCLGKMGQRLHKSDTIAYCSLPASTLEKYISLLLIIVLYYLLGCVTVQMSYLIEGCINPRLFAYPADLPSPFYTLNINGFLLINPFAQIGKGLLSGGTIFCLGLGFFSIIKFRHILYAMANTLGWVIVAIILFGRFDWGEVPLYLLGIGCFVAAYVFLYKLQQRS